MEKTIEQYVGQPIHKRNLNQVLDVVMQMVRDCEIELHSDVISDNFLGSTGKVEVMGDIDFAVVRLSKDDKKALSTHSQSVHSFNSTNGVSCIISYNDIETQELKYAQVDFIPGELYWLKQFFYRSVNTEFKGVHCNTLFAAILQWLRVIDDEIDVGFIMSFTRGFVMRTINKNSDKETEYGKPIYTRREIAELIFGPEYANHLDSVEGVYQALTECGRFTEEQQNVILETWLSVFLHRQFQGEEYPWHKLKKAVPYLLEEVDITS